MNHDAELFRAGRRVGKSGLPRLHHALGESFGGAPSPVVDDPEPLPEWVLSDLPRNRAVIDRALVQHADGSVWAVAWRQSGLGSAVYPLPKATLFAPPFPVRCRACSLEEGHTGDCFPPMIGLFGKVRSLQ